MEKDMVCLAIAKYNELRDFKKEVEKSLEESKVLVIEEGWGVTGGYTRKYYTESEAVLELEAKNKELRAKIEKAEIKEPVEISINDLKKMSYWEFRKWRKS